MTNKIKVQQHPVGTADVLIGSVVVKTFGGTVARQAAEDFANLLRQELAKPDSTPVEDIAKEAKGFIRGRSRKDEDDE